MKMIFTFSRNLPKKQPVMEYITSFEIGCNRDLSSSYKHQYFTLLKVSYHYLFINRIVVLLVSAITVSIYTPEGSLT